MNANLPPDLQPDVQPDEARIDLDPAESLKPGEDDWNEACAFCDGWPTIYPTGMCRVCAALLETSGRLVR